MVSSDYTRLPQKTGVYKFKDASGKLLYVGKAKNLRLRTGSYFGGRKNLGSKTLILVNKTKRIFWLETETELEALLLEAALIRQEQPVFNSDLKGGYPYPLIKIEVGKEYPPVLMVREEREDGAVYFGPFPRTREVRRLLRFLRRIFPFVSTSRHPKRRCLYNHLGLCPCPPVFDSFDLKKTYRRNIDDLIKILSGQKRFLIKDLEKRMKLAAKKEKFEQAVLIKSQLEALCYVSQNFRLPEDYLKEPDLLEDIRNKEIQILRKSLSDGGYLNVEPKRIEGYDISNLSGQEATGSMVVFVKGEAKKSHYRRFKIKEDGGPNDILMLQEVLRRRFGQGGKGKVKTKDASFSQRPDLILVDGGLGQVRGAVQVLKRAGLEIPVLGLAKKLEKLYIGPNGSEVKLAKHSPALKLVQRVRDEAHRFARDYHLKKRSDKILR